MFEDSKYTLSQGYKGKNDRELLNISSPNYTTNFMKRSPINYKKTPLHHGTVTQRRILFSQALSRGEITQRRQRRAYPSSGVSHT